MCFDRSTVLRMGGTYVDIELPYYALLVGVAGLVFTPVLISRLKNRGARGNVSP
jgi:hypothetical protein